jgi:hypothetical protein
VKRVPMVTGYHGHTTGDLYHVSIVMTSVLLQNTTSAKHRSEYKVHDPCNVTYEVL